MELTITSKSVNKQCILELSGEIDVYTYPSLNQALLNLIKEGQKNIILNLEKVIYIDSTGLGVLANCTSKLAEKNGILKIITTQAQLIKIFSVSGLVTKNLQICATEAEALASKKKKS
jgi:anti-sigma B factor antagonist